MSNCVVRLIVYFYLIDEGALVMGAKTLGFSFKVRTHDNVVINAVRGCYADYFNVILIVMVFFYFGS